MYGILKIVKKKKGFCFVGNWNITEHVESKQNKDQKECQKIDCLPTDVAVLIKSQIHLFKSTAIKK
jgi:hypothetical protein